MRLSLGGAPRGLWQCPCAVPRLVLQGIDCIGERRGETALKGGDPDPSGFADGASTGLRAARLWRRSASWIQNTTDCGAAGGSRLRALHRFTQQNGRVDTDIPRSFVSTRVLARESSRLPPGTIWVFLMNQVVQQHHLPASCKSSCLPAAARPALVEVIRPRRTLQTRRMKLEVFGSRLGPIDIAWKCEPGRKCCRAVKTQECTPRPPLSWS